MFEFRMFSFSNIRIRHYDRDLQGQNKQTLLDADGGSKTVVQNKNLDSRKHSMS